MMLICQPKKAKKDNAQGDSGAKSLFLTKRENPKTGEEGSSIGQKNCRDSKSRVSRIKI
jgi:hypothetical protein